jgi:hypothetical protein
MAVVFSPGKDAPFFERRLFYQSLALLFFWHIMCSWGSAFVLGHEAG